MIRFIFTKKGIIEVEVEEASKSEVLFSKQYLAFGNIYNRDIKETIFKIIKAPSTCQELVNEYWFGSQTYYSYGEIVKHLINSSNIKPENINFITIK